MKATRNYDDIPDNVFGRSRAFSMAVRQRYKLLFELFQKSGLRISEALGLKVQHIRVVDGVAKHVRVIGKGNKERQVPLPEAFGRVLALSLTGYTCRLEAGQIRPLPGIPVRVDRAPQRARGGFQSLTDGIDTTTIGGKLVFHIMGALAEFERDLIRERTKAGMKAAQKRGPHVGRP